VDFVSVSSLGPTDTRQLGATAMKNLQFRRRMVSASAVCAAALVLGVVAIAGQGDPLAKTEPSARGIKRTQGREADVRQPQLDLLAAFSSTE
jgi:hypothetical protein